MLAEHVELIEYHALAPEPDLGAASAEPDVYCWAARSRRYELAKRSIDVIVSLVALVGLAPLWLVISVLVALSSAGPIIHRDIVVGRGGRRFTWFKFRTMRIGDNGEHRAWIRDYVREDRPYRDGIYKLTPDPRVTVIGAWLRRFSLDEVPQFINVLAGDMSVVGPRPPLEYEFEHYDDFARRRLAVRPGITGLHQVTGRGRAPFSAMLATDIEYIESRSIRKDTAIMARTLKVMLAGEGAA